MRNTLILFIAIAIVSGCEEEERLPYTRLEVHKHCPESSRQERDRFVLKCIENANPRSDEEPEDWIELCGEMGKDIHCEDRLYRQWYRPIGDYYQGQERYLIEGGSDEES